jgi:8-oxo-dGTP pyrophosphatase MutT (NUDIX family)
MIALIRSLFFRPPALQVAALCWREGGEVLLIRTLGSNRWILPKGWPMRGKTLAEAAALEAWEEAGVKGRISPTAIGCFQSEKRRGSGVKQASRVEVFALKVETTHNDFPEADQRQLRWFSAADAAKKLREPEMHQMIQRLLGPVA